MTPANENVCEVRETLRSMSGRAVGFRPAVREPVQVARAAGDTVLTHYAIWHFDDRGEQVAEAQCVLRRGEAANTFALGFFTAKVGRPAAPTGRPWVAWLGVSPTTSGSAISAGTTCYWTGWGYDVICGGVVCHALFSTRAPTSAHRAVVAAEPVGGATAAFVLTWECTNGGGLSMTANGTVTYHLPGNESGGAGGPGNPCGGGGGGSSGGNDDGTVDPPGGGGEATLWWGASCDSVHLDDGLSFDPDPSNDCAVLLAQAGASGLEGWNACVAGLRPYMAGHPSLVDCPNSAVFTTLSRDGPAHPSGAWELLRIGQVKSKSFGGVLRFPVAYYRGAVSIGSLPPEPIEGDLWCTVGIGIFR